MKLTLTTAPLTAMTFIIPLETVNELNDHSHWRVRQRRAKLQNKVVAEFIVEQLAKLGHPMSALRAMFPCRVTFTRIAPSNGLDPGDGLPSAFKFVRDVLTKLIGVDDRSPDYEWEYEQRRGPYAVQIEVTRSLPSCPGCAPHKRGDGTHSTGTRQHPNERSTHV